MGAIKNKRSNRKTQPKKDPPAVSPANEAPPSAPAVSRPKPKPLYSKVATTAANEKIPRADRSLLDAAQALSSLRDAPLLQLPRSSESTALDIESQAGESEVEIFHPQVSDYDGGNWGAPEDIWMRDSSDGEQAGEAEEKSDVEDEESDEDSPMGRIFKQVLPMAQIVKSKPRNVTDISSDFMMPFQVPCGNNRMKEVSVSSTTSWTEARIVFGKKMVREPASLRLGYTFSWMQKSKKQTPLSLENSDEWKSLKRHVKEYIEGEQTKNKGKGPKRTLSFVITLSVEDDVVPKSQSRKKSLKKDLDSDDDGLIPKGGDDVMLQRTIGEICSLHHNSCY